MESCFVGFGPLPLVTEAVHMPYFLAAIRVRYRLNRSLQFGTMNHLLDSKHIFSLVHEKEQAILASQSGGEDVVRLLKPLAFAPRRPDASGKLAKQAQSQAGCRSWQIPQLLLGGFGKDWLQWLVAF